MITAGRTVGSWGRTAAASEHLETGDGAPSSTHMLLLWEHLSRPSTWPSQVPGSWLADEVTETDYNYLNNSWSPRLRDESLIQVTKPSQALRLGHPPAALKETEL